MRKNANKSFYHYICKTINEDGTEKYEYFLTLKQLEEKLKVSRFTLNNALNTEGYKMRKCPNIILKRCYIPVIQEIKLENKDLDYIREKLYT
jgi:hypothetical protein